MSAYVVFMQLARTSSLTAYSSSYVKGSILGGRIYLHLSNEVKDMYARALIKLESAGHTSMTQLG